MKVYISCFELSYTLLIVMHKMEETNNFFLKHKYDKMIFPWNLPTTRCIFSEAWGKRSLLYDQTIEDINIYYSAFFGWVEGGGLTYMVAQLTPLSPTLTWQHFRNHHVWYVYFHVDAINNVLSRSWGTIKITWRCECGFNNAKNCRPII